MPRRPSPRIFIIPASEADIAAIFLRGPSAWYHIIKWDTRLDTFESGAWIRGRIYPERCDLSPDGLLLVYFVHQGHKGLTEYTCAWTGVSRLPWVSALALWPWGSTWGGGGRFLGARHVRLHAKRVGLTHEMHPGTGLEVECGDCPYHRSTEEIEGADWSGRDRQGRLIFARDGKIYRHTKDDAAAHLVADLNGLSPNPTPAPAWAAEPLMPQKARRIKLSKGKRKMI